MAFLNTASPRRLRSGGGGERSIVQTFLRARSTLSLSPSSKFKADINTLAGQSQSKCGSPATFSKNTCHFLWVPVKISYLGTIYSKAPQCIETYLLSVVFFPFLSPHVRNKFANYRAAVKNAPNASMNAKQMKF